MKAAEWPRRRRLAGVLLAVQAVALVLAHGASDPAIRPVTVALGGTPRHLVSHVDLGLALAVTVALLAVGRLAPARIAPWIDPLLTTPIAVFTIALLNGIDDVGALVGVYALASAGVLFAMVQGAGGRASRKPLGYGAAVGIVPWGIIAFQQVGAMLAGSPVGGGIVLITLVGLASAVAEFVAAWRGARVVADGARILGLSLVAWLIVALL